MKKFAAFFACIVLIFCVISFADAASWDKPEKFVVNVDTRLNVRSGPGLEYDVFTTFRNGTVIDVAGYDNGWAMVLHDFGYGYAETIGFVDPAYLRMYNGGNTNSGSNNSGTYAEYVTTEGTTQLKVKESMSGWLNVRKSNSLRAGRIGKLYAGDKVYVASQKGDWYKIVYNGRYAYVMAKYIDGVPTAHLPDEGELFKVNVTPGTKLNVREGMSKKKDVITRLSNGEYIKVVETYDEWSKIYYKSGKTGYVMNKFITPVK